MYRQSRRTHPYHPLLLACALSGLAASVHAQNAFYTTGTYTIDATHAFIRNAYVGEDSGYSPTDSMGNPYNPTVNVSGGIINTSLNAYNSSTINISGGSIGNYLYAINSSTINISGGSVDSYLQASNSSTINISGGSIGNYLYAINSSVVNISGGTVGSYLQALNSTTVNVSGGTFGSYLTAQNSTTVNVSGGTFGQFDGVNFFDKTTGGFTLVGNNLLATNTGTDLTFGGTDYALSGTLQSGTNLTGYVLNVQSGSTFKLQPAATPEPGSVALLVGLSVTGLALLARHKRSRKPRKSAGY